MTFLIGMAFSKCIHCSESLYKKGYKQLQKLCDFVIAIEFAWKTVQNYSDAWVFNVSDE